MELHELTATQAVAALRAGEITAEAYADALLARCYAHKGLNAFISQDPERVREAARAADAKRTAGDALGPLHGVPLALKDNIDTTAYPTTAGTPGLRDNNPSANAPIAQALLDAGAVLLGKTNLHELAYGVTNNNGGFGAARNPYDPDRIPGGSSGGTGSAVAARLAPAGLGSDTGGSVRIPAALCGIAGLRPSIGRYAQTGIVPISHTRDTAGPMARSVADCALLDQVIAGGQDLQPARLDGLRLGVPRGYYYADIDSELAAVVEGALATLKDVGVELVEADIPGLAEADQAASMPVALYETVIDLNQYLVAHGLDRDFAALVEKVASPDVKGILSSLLGEGAIPEAVYREALETHRPRLQALLADHFAQHELAGIVFPTTPAPAPRIGDDETFEINGTAVPTFMTLIRNTDPASNAGIPGLSIPCGLTPNGLPVGLEIDGPAGSDRELLAIGLAIEAAMPTLPAPAI